MRLFVVAFLLVLACGCGRKQPLLAGGKPVGYWVEALHDPDPGLRQKAASKLGNVGPADAAVLPALIEALRDADPHVRCEAILALVKFGSGAKAAIPALAEVERQDTDDRVRTYAAKALQRLQSEK
jgi:HEAT repeat protein